ncbi:hypothetical protein BC828DRAFT_380867 [Blastocladiella britannica]|nr:hypothetical protein BC828DRAFT_380867 [Blastocladiella britannica]
MTLQPPPPPLLTGKLPALGRLFPPYIAADVLPPVWAVCAANRSLATTGTSGPRQYLPASAYPCPSVVSGGRSDRLDACIAANCSGSSSVVAREQCAIAKCNEAWAAAAAGLCVPLELPAMVAVGATLLELPKTTGMSAMVAQMYTRLHSGHLRARNLPPAADDPVLDSSVGPVLPIDGTDWALELGVCMPTPPVGSSCTPALFRADGFPVGGDARVAYTNATSPIGRKAVLATVATEDVALWVAVTGTPYGSNNRDYLASPPIADVAAGPSLRPYLVMANNTSSIPSVSTQAAAAPRPELTSGNLYSLVSCDPGTGTFVASLSPGAACRRTSECQMTTCSAAGICEQTDPRSVLPTEDFGRDASTAALSAARGRMTLPAFGLLLLVVVLLSVGMSPSLPARLVAFMARSRRRLTRADSVSTVARELELKPANPRMLDRLRRHERTAVALERVRVSERERRRARRAAQREAEEPLPRYEGHAMDELGGEAPPSPPAIAAAADIEIELRPPPPAVVRGSRASPPTLSSSPF